MGTRRRRLRLRTRVFELAPQYGYRSDTQLARAMDLSQATITRLRNGVRFQISPDFIAGATLAFPDLGLGDLFVVEPEQREDERELEPA